MMRVTTLIVLVAGLIAATAAAEMTAEQIVDRIDEVANQPQMRMRYEEVIVTAGGVKTTYTVEVYGKNGDEKQLSRYLDPAKVRGTAFLMLDHGNDIWAYFSSTGRVRLIARHMRKQKMMGSEFTNWIRRI